MSIQNPTTLESRKAQGRLAVAVRDYGPDHPITRERREYWQGESYIAAVQAAVANAPKLTPDQRATLRQILAGAPLATDQVEIRGASA